MSTTTMPDPRPRWAHWTAHRRHLDAHADEAAAQRQIARWTALLADERALPDDVLDRELTELLVRIHRAC